jgi:Fibronectin type III domain
MIPHYDTPGLTFDSGLTYDDTVVLPGSERRKMAKVKLDLKDKSDSELYEFAQQHITAMAGNVNFTTPDPLAPAFLTLVTNFNTALQAAIVAQAAAKEKTSLKEDARAVLETGLRARGNYVENKSNGVEAIILSAGLPVKNPSAPISELMAPANLAATMGSLEGQVKLKWKAVRGAVSYIVQKSAEVSPRVWSQVTISPNARATVTGLTSGDTYAFRVCAVGTVGQGPWSDEAVKMAP